MNTSRVSDFAFTSTRRQNAFKEEEKEHDYQVLPEIRSRFKEKEETNTYEVHNFELKGINKPSNYENPNIGLVQHNSQIGFNSYINGSEEIHAPRNYAYLNNFKKKKKFKIKAEKDNSIKSTRDKNMKEIFESEKEFSEESKKILSNR